MLSGRSIPRSVGVRREAAAKRMNATRPNIVIRKHISETPSQKSALNTGYAAIVYHLNTFDGDRDHTSSACTIPLVLRLAVFRLRKNNPDLSQLTSRVFWCGKRVSRARAVERSYVRNMLCRRLASAWLRL